MSSSAVRRLLGAGLVAGAALSACTPQAPAANPLGFTPITTGALPCSATGFPAFAAGATGEPTTPTKLMQSFDSALPMNAPASSNTVGRQNDMIALSPDGKYLYAVSENSIPTEGGVGVDGSDGVTRYTFATGRKEILADDVDAAGKNVWQRVDGVKWYPHGGPGTSGPGVLLISEEYSTGGIWQVNPDTGAFVRLGWLGNFSHEGIGLDAAGNLYLGDENRTGALYKAVPNNPDDLTAGGTLSYLVGTSIDASGWKAVVDPTKAISEANNGGAILFDRPEDFDERNGRVYFAVTEPNGDAVTRHGNYNGTATGGVDASLNQVVNGGGVYSVNTAGVPDLAVQSGSPKYTPLTPMIAVNDSTYASQAAAQAQQGLQFPDNLAFDGAGHLWVHEDIPDGATFPASGIDVSKQARNQQDELYVFELNATGDGIVANPDASGPGVSGGYKAADMRTSASATPDHACENEFTGGIFGADGTLFINQQHYDNPTLAVKFG